MRNQHHRANADIGNLDLAKGESIIKLRSVQSVRPLRNCRAPDTTGWSANSGAAALPIRPALFDHLVSTGEKRRRDQLRRKSWPRRSTGGTQLYKCSVCNPGKCPDTQRMVFASRPGSPDIAHDRYVCIAV